MNDDEQLSAVALAIFRRVQKNNGLPKAAADARWRAMGSEGRSKWRLVARAAMDAQKGPIKYSFRW